MKAIVILSDSPVADNGLVSLVEKLFPQAQIQILSRTTMSSMNSQGSPDSEKSGNAAQKQTNHFLIAGDQLDLPKRLLMWC